MTVIAKFSAPSINYEPYLLTEESTGGSSTGSQAAINDSLLSRIRIKLSYKELARRLHLDFERRHISTMRNCMLICIPFLPISAAAWIQCRFKENRMLTLYSVNVRTTTCGFCSSMFLPVFPCLSITPRSDDRATPSMCSKAKALDPDAALELERLEKRNLAKLPLCAWSPLRVPRQARGCGLALLVLPRRTLLLYITNSYNAWRS